MGIRFQCHLCNEELHVKSYLAGKRGKCPACGESFRVPPEGEAFSRTVDGEIAVRQQKLETVSVGSKPTIAKLEAAPADKLASKKSSAKQEPIDSSVPERLGDKPRAKPAEKSSSKATSKASTRLEEKPTESTSIPSTSVATAGWPKAIAEAPQAAWFVRPPSGGQFGPAVGDVFHSWLKENRVGRDALVWREGWPEWQLATVVFPECFPNLVLPSPVAPELPTASVSAVAAPNALPSPAAAVAEDVAVQGAVQARPTLMRKKKGRRQQVALIATLGVISVVLIIALIVVLVTQL